MPNETVPLTDEKLAERRSNLAAFREMGMEDDSTLATNLIMQEEWLATIDAQAKHITDLEWLVGEKDGSIRCQLGGRGCADYKSYPKEQWCDFCRAFALTVDDAPEEE